MRKGEDQSPWGRQGIISSLFIYLFMLSVFLFLNFMSVYLSFVYLQCYVFSMHGFLYLFLFSTYLLRILSFYLLLLFLFISVSVFLFRQHYKFQIFPCFSRTHFTFFHGGWLQRKSKKNHKIWYFKADAKARAIQQIIFTPYISN